MLQIWNFFIVRLRFTLLLIFMIFIAGLIGITSIPKESTPEVKVPFASITTIYPGASPLDVEELITDVLEEQIINVEDLKNVDSNSSEGISMIFTEFDTSADIKERVRAVQEAVNKVSNRLPEGAEEPIVTELNFSNDPILILSLSSDLPHSVLVEKAERLETEILNISTISEVQIVGARSQEVSVNIDPARLEEYNISLLEVFAAIQSADSNLPVGSIENSSTAYSLRFSGELELKDLQGIVIRTVNGVPIYLRDLGEIRLGLIDTDQSSRVSVDGESPKDALSIQVFKRAGGDIIVTVDKIFEIIDELKQDELKDVDVINVFDSAADIREQLGELSLSGLQTVVLVFIVLLVTLGFREAFIAGLSIPLTFLITFAAFTVTGQTINFLSLFSLILALGILVDTGVVITEGMHTRVEAGKDSQNVALETIREYQLPLITGTMTTVAAFLPMMFMSGILGEFVKHIPRTVILTLMASLFVGLALLPSIGSRLLKNVKHQSDGKILKMIKRFYAPNLRFFLEKKSRQTLAIVTITLIFFASLALPATGVLKLTLFPDEDFRLFFVEIELPKGALVEETNEVVEKVEDILLSTPEIESYTVDFGTGSSAEGFGGSGAVNANIASVSVNLREERDRTSLEIIDEYRTRFAAIPGGNVEVVGLSGGPPSGEPIEFRIFGSELNELEKLSTEATQLLEGIDGTVNVKSSLDEETTEFVLNVDRSRVELAGIDPSTIGQLARIAVTGVQVNTIKLDGEEIDVVLKADVEDSINRILALPIPTPTGSYPLSYFVELELEPAPTTIVHKDGDRVVVITASVEQGFLPSVVLPEFQSKYNPDLKPGYRVEYGGEAEELQESLTSLATAMVFGLLLILVILLLQFNSFKQSFIVLFTIPLALIGVFSGLTILGLPLSFPAFIGVVALGGIVVNNAIILIDRINKNRERGANKFEAVYEAGIERLQPILLTSVTTITGILPLALSNPSWGPLGFSIISGLLFSTVLTLIVIPAAYMRFIK